jgi:hypothetical protein
MLDKSRTLNRAVRVRFVRGCICNGKPYAEGAEASLDPLEAGLLFGQGAVTLDDPADVLVLRDAAQADYRATEQRFKHLERAQQR